MNRPFNIAAARVREITRLVMHRHARRLSRTIHI
jgi:hypothetical protein